MATQPSYSVDLALRAKAADDLAVAARQAQAMTHASGAAIAIRTANSSGFLCCANSGPNAPDIGATVRVEGTLTGVCVESGKEVFCGDVETDTRVDTAAARALGIRSMLVAPITEQTSVSGVLAVFSAMPHAFGSVHVAVLKALADQISFILQKERVTGAEEHCEPPVRSNPAALKMVLPIAAGGTAAEPVRAFMSVPTVPSDEPETLSGGKSRERRWKLSSALRHGLAAIDELANAGRNKRMVIAAIAGLLVIAVVTTLLLKRGGVSSTAVQATQHEQPNNMPSRPSGVASEPGQPGDVSDDANPEKVVDDDPQGNHAKKTHQRQPAVVVPNLKTTRKLLTSQVQLEDVAPNLNLGHNHASDLTLLAQSTNNVPLAMASSFDLVPAKLIHAVRPIYPNIAKISRVSGAVVLQVVVGTDGKVISPKLIKGPLVLRDAAFDAIRQWIFQPAMLHGRPVEQETRVTLNFKPQD